MRRFRALLVGLFALGLVGAFVVPAVSNNARSTATDEGNEGPYPPGLYLQMREAQIEKYRGIPWHTSYNARVHAVRAMRAQVRTAAANSPDNPHPAPSWSELGPAPIPNGGPGPQAMSGRVTSIVVDPVDSNTVFIGGAQGGVWRTTDGGATWTPLMDSANSMAIGALAITSDGSTLFVGTGEGNFSGDSFFGVGLYKIASPKTTATVTGPFDSCVSGLGTCAGSGKAFSGTSISGIAFDSTNDLLWVSTVNGIGGLGGSFPPSSATAGLYVSNNPGTVTPTFKRVGAPLPAGQVTDVALKPGAPDTILVGLLGSNSANNGIWQATDASGAGANAEPTFAKVKDLSSFGFPVTKLAFAPSASATAFAAFDNDNGGAVIKSTDSGGTWGTALATATGHCDGQCWYDDPIAVDPSNADVVLIGGNYHYGAGNAFVLMKSTNGTNATPTFGSISNEGGLHPDNHAIAFNNDGTQVWDGNDGGVWKSTDDGSTWTNKNTSGLGITQFQGISTDPSNANVFIGGTQDNGTEKYTSGATWTQTDGGDGGFALIDQSTASVMYHTYYNATGSQIGFARTTNSGTTWPNFYGCGGTADGINCADSTLFYAPMALGPGTPNNLYFGTNKLYRSTDEGVTMTQVSQAFNSSTPISAIGIAPTNDAVRLVGLTDGHVYVTTTGAGAQQTYSDITGAWPSAYVGRVVIDPSDASVAYVTLDNYFGSGTAHVWKTQNLNLGASATWSQAGAATFPDVPVNALVIDPNNTADLFAGTDIGVYESTDGGSTWSVYGTGLPNVAVFDLGIQQPGTSNEALRAATHGRGVWTIPISSSGSGSHTLTVSKAGTGSGTVTSTAPDGSINCGSACSHSYTDGTQVTLHAAAASGSHFAGWSGGGCSGTSDCIVTINGTTFVTATFNKLGALHKPDAWVRDLKGVTHGKDTYCSTPCAKQIVHGYGGVGAKGSFLVTVQNDAIAKEQIDITGPGNASGVTVKYVSGPSCCHTPLNAFAVLGPGQKVGINVVVTITRGATLGRNVAFKITAKSDKFTAKDVVEIVIQRNKRSSSRLLLA